MTIKVTDTILLELLEEKHTVPVFNLINANRNYLSQWLPWVSNMKTIDNFSSYITTCKKQYNEGSDIGFVIIFNNQVVGRIGLHYINQQNKTGAIGYWLAKDFAGNGIVTTCCQAIIAYGFTSLNLNRIEIKCATENYKSKAIAERLHFTQEGILRKAELVNTTFIDLFIFSLLKNEWENKV